MTPLPPSEGTDTFARSSTGSSTSPKKPRIVDVRDFPHHRCFRGGLVLSASPIVRTAFPFSTCSPARPPVVPKLWPSGGGRSRWFAKYDRRVGELAVRFLFRGGPCWRINLAIGNGGWEGTNRVFVRRRAGNSTAKSSFRASPTSLTLPSTFPHRINSITKYTHACFVHSGSRPRV